MRPVIFDPNVPTPSLPLWPRVVFVDWDGVLCQDVFWSSIRNNPQHPLHGQLSAACKGLFSRDHVTLQSWMRGSIDDSDVIRSLHVCLGRKYRPDFLLRRLRRDCSRMKSDVRVGEVLRRAGQHSFVVLATDNMDCFVESVTELEGIDAVLCSSVLGVLKSESCERFFGTWLRSHRLSFSDALLLDDSAANCAAFRNCGGTSILFHDSAEVEGPLMAWAETASGVPGGRR